MTNSDRPTTTKEAKPQSEPDRKPLRFSVYSFEPRDWELDRIHRYSVRSPRWWTFWVRVREAGAKLGIA